MSQAVNLGKFNAPPEVSFMTPHDAAHEILDTVRKAEKLNEADTRHSVIDRTLHEVLGWPRLQTKCESYIGPGYSDYVLLSRREAPIIIIEAKKSGTYFSLPKTFTSDDNYRFVKARSLMTDANTRAAMEQVQKYCSETGCEYAAITNGNQWIIFKTFEAGMRWQDLNAFVIERYEYFVKQFTSATQRLSYTAIDDDASA